MCSKFVLAIRFCSAEMAILVGKMANGDCYSSSVYVYQADDIIFMDDACISS